VLSHLDSLTLLLSLLALASHVGSWPSTTTSSDLTPKRPLRKDEPYPGSETTITKHFRGRRLPEADLSSGPERTLEVHMSMNLWQSASVRFPTS
jgi:hypothetical protein